MGGFELACIVYSSICLSTRFLQSVPDLKGQNTLILGLVNEPIFFSFGE